jgi:soluble lytic murein transglycosylase
MRTRILLAAVTVMSLGLMAPAGARVVLRQQLAPTVHPSLPSDASDLWLVPSDRDRAARSTSQHQPLTAAVQRYQAGDFEAALQLASAPALKGAPLSAYARYYTGLAQLKLARLPEARRTLDALIDSKPTGALAAAAVLAAGEAAEAAGDNAGALRLYTPLAANKLTVSDDVLDRIGRTALAVGERKQAAEAYVRLYYEFPLTPAGGAASPQLDALKDLITRNSYDGDIGRAQILFGARRYSDARNAFLGIRSSLSGDSRELADLRIAECDFYLKNYAAARDGVAPYLQKASRLAEARYFHLSATRELGDHAQYISLAKALVSDFPESSWAEESLNNLATYYILTNDDESAAATFRDMYARYPSGQYAERAAWKYGWWSYKTGDHPETIRVFEAAAATFPRSNYRPSFIYWAARAHAKNGEASSGTNNMRLVFADYGSSYYGRLAEGHLRRAGLLPPRDSVRTAAAIAQAAPPALPTDGIIRQLLASGLYDDALNELRYAQRAWGTSPAIDATIAWAYNQKGELRRAITIMRRAYPQHLTAGGQQLPAEILQVIYPLTYWESIRRESAARNLDPYLIAALIGQESTFDPKIRSAANAWGLMQIVPATGRRLGRALGLGTVTTDRLTDPELNIKLGTYYFSRLVEQFGGTYYALASYNAGENRVVRWKAERPGLDEDEFIDDIPFPETQNYVKRILGTAEDYRLLYGSGEVRPAPIPAAAPGTAPMAAALSARADTPTANAAAAKGSTARKSVTKPAAKRPAAKKPAAKKPAAKKPATKKAPARKTKPTRPRG